jgi:hypothetical protein
LTIQSVYEVNGKCRPGDAGKTRLTSRAGAGILSAIRCTAMTAVAIEPEPVPLVRDQAGRLMVTGARISLDVLVADFYAIFAYYLRHRAEVDS